MAKAKKLPSGNYRVLVYDYTDSNNKRHYESFTSSDKKEAEFLAAQFTLTKNKAKTTPTLTFGDGLSSYIRKRASLLSQSTVGEYARIRRTEIPTFMDTEISKINQDLVQETINEYSKTHSPKSVYNIHGIISVVLKEFRPTFGLTTTLPQKVRPKIYVPSDQEISKLLEVTKNSEMEIAILLAAFGPMRRSEIAALNSNHIDGNTIHVEFALVKNEHRQWVLKTTKSYSGNRLITFPDFVIERIKDIDGAIIKLKPSQITDRFSDILKKHDIPHFRFHDLRHYNASILHALGVPDQYIMARGGWSSDRVLKNVYRHSMSEKEKEVTAVINQHFSKVNR